MDKQVAYRFEEQTFSTGCDEWGEPNQGYTLRIWIYVHGRKRFVPLFATKIYAHPDKEQALLSYIMRKKSQIRIYEAKIKMATQGMTMALKHSGHTLAGYTFTKVGIPNFGALDKDSWYSWV